MRRLSLAALCAFVAVSAGAQTIPEALQYSENNYYGTARSIALGNAVTALGGDLGSIGINPAGGAVARYSQFTVTPGVTLMSTSADYSCKNDMDYANLTKTSWSKSALPNIGFNLRLDTGSRRGLKSISFGFLSNTTNRFSNEFVGQGSNPFTSLQGSFAYAATPYLPEDLIEPDNYFDTSIPWNVLLAYQSGMIAEGLDEEGNVLVDGDGNVMYAGTTERIDINEDGSYDIHSAGELSQLSSVRKTGSKQDLVLNAAFNFNDRLFLGVNLGLPYGSFSYNERFYEDAVDPSQFEIRYGDDVTTNFTSATYEYDQVSDFSGIYAKVGVIFLPVPGLRLGAAVQTPTAMEVTDRWHVDASTQYSNSKYNTDAWSPDNEFCYNIRTPWRYNFGVAGTLANIALLSADIEFTDYSTMRFCNDRGDTNPFFMENRDIQNYTGRQIEARFGAEVKVLPDVAIRAGYTFRNNGNYYSDGTPVEGKVQSGSIGMGYSSLGSFFADFAFRLTKYYTEYFNPYSDYFGGYLPETRYTRNLSDVVATIGWRF